MIKKDKLEKVKEYINKMFLDKSMSYTNNETINGVSTMQLIILGEMICLSELKRVIDLIDKE